MTTPGSRNLSAVDQILDQLDQGLRTVFAGPVQAQRDNPADAHPKQTMDESASRHAAGLMRINHTGEVCAQALYYGQAAVARSEAVKTQMLQAADEETDHLAWCEARLQELHSRPSQLNPFWYAASFAIGAAAGLRGDGWNLGFVVETERQVEAHLESHLDQLPADDQRSRAILQTMKEDEARHAQEALDQGGRELPAAIKAAMSLTSKVMKWTAYRI